MKSILSSFVVAMWGKKVFVGQNPVALRYASVNWIWCWKWLCLSNSKCPSPLFGLWGSLLPHGSLMRWGGQAEELIVKKKITARLAVVFLILVVVIQQHFLIIKAHPPLCQGSQRLAQSKREPQRASEPERGDGNKWLFKSIISDTGSSLTLHNKNLPVVFCLTFSLFLALFSQPTCLDEIMWGSLALIRVWSEYTRRGSMLALPLLLFLSMCGEQKSVKETARYKSSQHD